MPSLNTSWPFKNPRALALAAALVIFAFLQASHGQSSDARNSQSRVPGQPQGQKSPAPPSVRVTTRMVQVSVIVHDKDGKPVTGLTKDDFVLLDQGQRQQLA